MLLMRTWITCMILLFVALIFGMTLEPTRRVDRIVRSLFIALLLLGTSGALTILWMMP